MEMCVARQPIFDRKNEVYGYELLYRKDSTHNAFDQTVDADQASTETIINSFVEIGLEKLTNGRMAFVNFTENLILKDIPSLLPPKLLVVEILENIKPEQSVLRACVRLKQAGYLIAVDDFIVNEENLAFLDYADIVKIDFLATGMEAIYYVVDLIKKKKRSGAKSPILLAEKIENNNMYQIALRMGFHYFQGYYFSKPVIVEGRSLQPSAINRLRIFQLAMKPEFEFQDLAEVIRQDVSLSYRLLRLVNSAYFAFGGPVENIQQALVILGSAEIKKWVALMCLLDANPDKTVELTRMSLVRARFLELVAARLGREKESETLYLMGMFSLMDVIMDCPMEEILRQIHIDKKISAPLIEETGEYYELLLIIRDYERGDFEGAFQKGSRFGLQQADMANAYMEAIQWVGLLDI
ncbi:MAG: HDOD domain-containing protein [Clostridiales Family XIII bacterium]|jgi:EAL and modified HD-GYP domain-containing signal transduction protein|nr:HDOD domain-containing protein [Clostridiales Family XIII bacterium]